MADIVCSTCQLVINDDVNYFECDGCTTTFHLNCGGIKKQEYNAREKSTRIRLLCDECNSNDTLNIAERNIRTLLKFISKFDVTLQEQKLNMNKMELTIASNTEEMRQMKEEISAWRKDAPTQFVALNGGKDREENETMTQRPSPLNLGNGSCSTILPTVVVKPKNDNQGCEATLQKIRQKLAGSDVSVRDTHNIRGGGIVISCSNAGDTLKMKQLIESNNGDDMDVRLPEIQKPRVKIHKIDSSLTSDEIIDDIINKNEALTQASIQIKKVMKNKNGKTQDMVVEVDGMTFNRMIALGKLYIGWNRCAVGEHIYLKRCFKCCGFSHIAKECRHNFACSKCAGPHKSNECNQRQIMCVNCVTANATYGLNLTTNHHAWSRNCSVLQKRIKKLKEFIQYNPNE